MRRVRARKVDGSNAQPSAQAAPKKRTRNVNRRDDGAVDVALLAAVLAQLPGPNETWAAEKRTAWFRLVQYVIATPQKGTPDASDGTSADTKPHHGAP
jgi:hypothetical protein